MSNGIKVRALKKEFRQKATDLFHEWAKLPDYDPIDEDMAINLIIRIETLVMDAWLAGNKDTTII